MSVMTLSADRINRLRKRLREHRLRHNLSYEALAEAIGADRVSLATVRRFIESETDPHETTVYAIESYLQRSGEPS